MPAIQDYAGFADVASFQQRLDYHYILNTNVQAGKYYIGVYNNDAYFKVRHDGVGVPCWLFSSQPCSSVFSRGHVELPMQETAQFSIMMEVQPASGELLCPFGCGGHGVCAAPGMCECNASWQGTACQVWLLLV